MKSRRYRGLSIIIALLLAAASPASASTGDFKVLHSFGSGHDGSGPESSLVADAEGNLYGTTVHGGATGNGALFELMPPSSQHAEWRERVLYSFEGSPDGATPGDVVFGPDGALYGATKGGGASFAGTFFRVALHRGHPAIEQVLYSFSNTATGQGGRILFARDGSVIGTQSNGGTFGGGTVYRLSPPLRDGDNWTFHTLHQFGQPGRLDGSHPSSGLVADLLGNLYGVTFYGGAHNYGAVYELTPVADGSVQQQILYSFKGGENDGKFPQGELLSDRFGNLFGVTSGGGNKQRFIGAGTAYELLRGRGDWTENVLAKFDRETGSFPVAGLVAGRNGTLYGTTETGGSVDAGVVYALTLRNGRYVRSVLYDFGFPPKPGTPVATLFMDSSGMLLGTASSSTNIGVGGEVFGITP